jgi:hypothetical protein
MFEQGCSTLSVREDGRILDRLAGLEKIVSPELMRDVLQASGRFNGRACELTHEVMLWVVLAMGLFTNMPIRQVFRHARRMRAGDKCPARSSLCVARQRLGVEPVQLLHQAVVHPLATRETPGAFYRCWRLMGIDGVLMDVPDTARNASFGRSKNGRGEAPFPQVRKASLVELGTHVEVAIAIGRWSDDERSLARQLWDHIPADALILKDRGFFSHDDWKDLYLRCKLLVRVRSSLVFKPIQRLSDGSYLAKVYPTCYARDKDRDGILLRVIEYTLDDPQRTGHGQTHRLVTNLLDATEAPALELIALYHERWEEELVFDEQKTHQDPLRAEKAAHLRSESPEGVRQELYALSLAHFIIRSLMFEAARPLHLDVDRLSFVNCFRVLQCRLPECDSRTAESLQTWYDALLTEIRSERVGLRRNRLNPRVIKRKMSKWPKKHHHHLQQKQPLKTFEQCIVMKI